MNLNQKQKGLTGISIVALLLVGAFFVLIGLTVVPIYLENFSVSSHVSRLSKDKGVASMMPEEVRETIMKRLDIDNVTSVTREDIIINVEKDKMLVDVEYEVRKSLFANIDVVIYFNEQAEILK